MFLHEMLLGWMFLFLGYLWRESKKSGLICGVPWGCTFEEVLKKHTALHISKPRHLVETDLGYTSRYSLKCRNPGIHEIHFYFSHSHKNLIQVSIEGTSDNPFDLGNWIKTDFVSLGKNTRVRGFRKFGKLLYTIEIYGRRGIRIKSAKAVELAKRDLLQKQRTLSDLIKN